ncbi:MAG: TrpB-like pyridoxal phosphate-dependent enzyme [Candidatus Nealsonbacteria bacterium]|nr:TrpB-like pyridoxal phosphate-dependent enzyme [Candidatus Nealsonbacteria bacterium]
MEKIKIILPERQLPQKWYNILPDLPFPMPPIINPATKKPVTPQDLSPIFPQALIEQEMSEERYIEIPPEVMDVYKIWRPTPLYRARHLEKALDTPARIYYKWEGVSPPGSHKPNTAVAQAFYNKREGVKKLTTETGAGQWGSALAFGCRTFGLDCKVYMVRVSYDQKPYRKIMMKIWGADVVASPSNHTQAGRSFLEKDADSPGSLGIAISEAVEEAANDPRIKYSLGSVLNHVLLHQTIIGQETKKQLESIGEKADILVGCVGGGSNFGGLFLPFVKDKLQGKNEKLRMVCVESTACPSLTKGLYKYDFGDTACTTPLLKMFTLGHDFIPAPIHAGGLRYHGMSPLVCALYDKGFLEAVAYHQNETFPSALQFARTEGFIPAPESAHAIKAVIDEAKKCKDEGKEKVIVFNFSGHGHFDLSAYQQFLAGKLEGYECSEEEIKKSLETLPEIE